MNKYIALLLVLMLSLAIASPVEAAFCRQQNNKLICISSIKRSAKYWWEYRAAVSVNGVVRPIEIYNCRQRVRIKKDGTVIPFESKGPGELICSVLQR